MNRHIRRLHLELNGSVAWLVDLLSLLPPDTIVVNATPCIAEMGWVFYLCHPDFVAIDPASGLEIPQLDIKVETFRSLLGYTTTRPSALVDRKTGQVFQRT